VQWLGSAQCRLYQTLAGKVPDGPQVLCPKVEIPLPVPDLLYLTSFYIFHIFNGYFAFHDESFIQFEISELTLAHELK
jgi:hypothetical protein